MSRTRVAACDIGSNTVHLLVAEPRDGGLDEVVHEEVMPRIGRAVQATGAVGAAKLAEVVGEVRRLAAIAREAGAEPLLLGATEAVRRAGDRDAVLAAVSEAAGVPCHLIAPEAEARLSFRGAASAHPGPGLTLVTDVGGASTECVLGQSGQIGALTSIPIGSGALTERWLAADPPTRDQLTAAAAAADGALGAAPAGSPLRGIATGGTASTLPALLGRPRGSAGGNLSGDDLEVCRGVLVAERSTDIAQRLGLDPARVRVLAGGVEILDAVRRRYGLEGLRASHQGLRDGMILAWLERGESWPEG